MKSGIKAQRGRKVPGLVLGWCGVVSLAAMRSFAQPAPLPASSNAITLTLQYQETKQSLVSWALSVTPQSAAFKKEPALSSSGVRRGRWDLGGLAEPPMAFIWDPKQAKLWLDLNRNEDLTDDTDGVFTSAEKSRDGRYQDFPDVRLTIKTDAGPHPLLLNLNLNGYSRLYATASLRSFYSGKLTLQDREWQLGIVDPARRRAGTLQDASLLLRAWEARNKPFQVESGTLDAMAFPTNLYFLGRAWRVTGQCEHVADTVRYRVQLTEQPVQLGELRFTGQFIHRAILRGAPGTVVLDEPAGAVPVPVGTYGAYQVVVQKGDAGAYPDVWPANRGINKKLVVAAEKPATLAAGGPLTNSVVLNRRGNKLVFSYRLLGADGESYRLLQQDRTNPPRFAVFKGNKQLASGKFEFG